MPTAFELQSERPPITQGGYTTPGAMEAEGQNLQASWTKSVLPAIWENTETSSNYFKGAEHVRNLNAVAAQRGETRLSVEELNAKYPGMDFNGPMYAQTAEYMAQRQHRLQDLEWIKRASTVKIPGSNFLPEMASYVAQSFTDPIDVGLMVATAGLAKGAGIIFPQITKFSGAGLAHKLAGVAIPENLIMAELQASTLPFSARMGGAALYGFAEQAAFSLAMEPWIASASKQLGDDYTALNSLMNVFVGGLSGSVMHIAGHAIGDPFMRMSALEKIKATKDYVDLRINGEDGVMAAAQNALPITSLAARDVMSRKNIMVTPTEDGQFRAHFKNDTGLLSYTDGVVGRSRNDAIRNLQYMYSTKMSDPVLFNELNKVYGEKASLDWKKLNPFVSGEGPKQIKNSNMITFKGKRHKLEFESPVDKMFYNIRKIMNMEGNKGKPFNEFKTHKDTIEGYVQWIVDNIGDTSEAEIRKHAHSLYTAVQKQVKETGSAKIAAFTAKSELAKGPAFLSTTQWAERLKTQRDILEGSDTEAAFKLLEELYTADMELQKTRRDKLKESAKDIQKLISTSETQLRNVAEREQTRTEIYNALKDNKNLSETQIEGMLTLLDYVTGDFSKYLKDYNISYTLSKEEQLAVEKRLMQTAVLEKKFANIAKLRQQMVAEGQDGIALYKLTPEELQEQSLTAETREDYSDGVIDALISAKEGKYDLQEALYMQKEIDFENRAQDYLDESQEFRYTALNELLNANFLKNDTILYRGIPAESALLQADITPGYIIQSPGFLSASFNAGIAEAFSVTPQTRQLAGQPTMLKIMMPKGASAIDIDATLAKHWAKSETLGRWQEEIRQAESSEQLGMEIEDAFEFIVGTSEGEVILPSELALKVLDVKTESGVRTLTVTPDATLNKLYGSNVMRDNIDILFNKVKSNEARLAELVQYKIGNPEHEQLAEAAFYDGIPLSQEVIAAYPNLKVAQDLAKEIPDTWLFQAAERNAFRNRIIGEWTRDLSFKDFDTRYGTSYLYDAGNGKFTKYPDLAIKRTGKAVLYDMGQGFEYNVREDMRTELQGLWDNIVSWNPLLKQFLTKPEEEQRVILSKVLNEAATLTNKAGVTFIDFLDALKNQTKKGKARTTLDAITFNWNSGEIVYSMKSYDKGPVQLGEPKILQGMTPEQAMDLTPEIIYKSMIKDELNKVENLQKDLAQALAAESRAKKQVAAAEKAIKKVETPTEETIKQKNELDKSLKTASGEVKKTKKKIEIAKRVREKKLENANKKSEPYNQVIKGMVDVSDEHKYIVHLFQNADISTLVHETAHIFRRTVLDTDLLERAEHALGVKDGKWTREHEEKFAEGFEKYLAEGKAPLKGLQGLFDQFKEWLTRIYMTLTQSPLEQELSPELRSIFDDLFAEERVKMAQEKAFASSQAGKDIMQAALTGHKNKLQAINENIRSIDGVLKQDLNPDNTTFERLRRAKLERINSKLKMLEIPEELTPEEIRDKMEDISNAEKDRNAEGVQLVEKQIQRNEEIQGKELEFYEDALAQDLATVTAYTKAYGISPERIEAMLEGEGLPDMPEELKISNIDKESEALKIIEGALKEFGDCARGEFE